MRTTLIIDDDLGAALKEQAKRTDQSFKQVVNDALRRGLSSVLPEVAPAYRVQPLDSGFKPGVDPLRLNQMSDELEVSESTGLPQR